MAAGLRSTQDRNSAGYMGKRSTFSDFEDPSSMRQTYGRKFCDIEPIKTMKPGVGQYERDLRDADRTPNLGLIGSKM